MTIENNASAVLQYVDLLFKSDFRVFPEGVAYLSIGKLRARLVTVCVCMGIRGGGLNSVMKPLPACVVAPRGDSGSKLVCVMHMCL